ncbi:ATP-binding protein [Achromobacter aloeverae]|uniref:ATP-binding protein n=1 Tax=Achromobacter aloeverae TaxID=1750518 RepID=UPI001865695E|nr:ATP-binding protein [Achromobacter aloeverae]
MDAELPDLAVEHQGDEPRVASLPDALFQQRKLDALSHLTGGLAHDFNNILQGLLGSLQLAQRRLATGETEKAGRLIDAGLNAGRRAAGLTHCLLAFAQRQSLDPKPVDVATLLRAMDPALRNVLGSDVALVMEVAPDLAPTLCDPRQLENALLGLAANARDAMADGGTLTLSLTREVLTDEGAAAENLAPGAYTCLTVVDNGSGMTPDVRERAFDPFFTTKPIGQGTGLGLSMVYGYVKQSDGNIALHSRDGEGTRLRILLPEVAALPQPVQEPGRITAIAGNPLVLVVDDDSMVRDLVTQVLADAGYRTIAAADAASAMTVLRGGVIPELLLTDVGLPGLNGRQLADAARELLPGQKVLFMTGYAANAVVGGGEALDPGMSVLMKPFEVGELTAKVAEMLENRH